MKLWYWDEDVLEVREVEAEPDTDPIFSGLRGDWFRFLHPRGLGYKTRRMGSDLHATEAEAVKFAIGWLQDERERVEAAIGEMEEREAEIEEEAEPCLT